MNLGNTEKLFYSDFYLTKTKAWIDEAVQGADGHYTVVTDRTVFFPQGGGQKGDRGFLYLGEEGNPSLRLPIVDTRKKDDVIHHVVAVSGEQAQALESAVGEMEVLLEIDWKFRYHQMRIHSTGHLIHLFINKVIGKELPYPARSPLDELGGENQYDFVDAFDEQQLVDATQQLNVFLAEGHEIKTFPDNEKASGFRWWACEGWRIPCGGLHPNSSSEIGTISTSMRVKKQQTRVTFQILDK